MSWWLVIVLAVIAAAAFLMRGRGPAAGARFLRRTGLTFISATTLFIGPFVAGETLADPGGWKAAGLVALWLVPLAGLSVLAWYRPGWATIPLAGLTAGTIALAVWFAADPGGWRAFEDHTGPVRALVSFAITLPIGLLGWRKPVTGGVLLLVLGIVPVAVSAAGSGFGAVSLTAISIPPVLTGLLYLLAELIGRRAASNGPAPEQAIGPGIGQRPLPDGADRAGRHTPGRHTSGPGGTGRPASGPDTPWRAA